MNPPTKLTHLDELAEANGWNITIGDPFIVEGASETVQHIYTRFVDDDFAFGFGITYGLRTETGRWNVLQLDGKWSVAGLLFFDEVVIHTWYWKAVMDLEFWLQNPERLFKDGIKLPTKTEAAFEAVIQTAFN